MQPDRPYLAELARRGYLHRPCSRCGFNGPQNIGDGVGPHPYRIRCARCDANLGFPPKPGNFDKRRHQADYRQAWRELLGGQLVCAVCGASETEDPDAAFHIDHIVDKAGAGGQLIDEFWNTIPLCNLCHTNKGTLQALRRRSSRRPPAANGTAA